MKLEKFCQCWLGDFCFWNFKKCSIVKVQFGMITALQDFSKGPRKSNQCVESWRRAQIKKEENHKINNKILRKLFVFWYGTDLSHHIENLI
jgi:hypothetical protein